MTIFVVGGSNSVFKDGWVSRFSECVGQPVRNLSIGASTTLAGLYRMILPDGPAEGDCVVWEYALNEINHIRRGYDGGTLLKNVENFIRLCQRRNIGLTPLIFTPKHQEVAPRRAPYFERLLALFAHYGIPVFDVSTEYRRRFSVSCLPDDLFEDAAHYARSGPLPEFIANGAAESIASAKVPAQQTPVYTRFRSLALLEGLHCQQFSNALLTVPIATVPQRLTTAFAGRLIGVYSLAFSGFDSGVRIELHPANGTVCAFRFSTTQQEPPRRPILKAISVEEASKEHWTFEAGDQIRCQPATQGGLFHAEYMIKRKLDAPVPPPAVLSGLLAETQPF